MYKIIYSHKSYIQIDNFINSYKEWFIRMFSDTWIDNEDLIINSYIQIWNNFYKNIIDNIKKTFQVNSILWKHKSEKWETFIIISVNNYRLFIYYKENNNLKERYIESIEFFKK